MPKKKKIIGMPNRYIPPKKKPMANAAMANGAEKTENIFSGNSIAELLGGMEFILAELTSRGVKIVDYENKNRVLQMIRPIGKDFCFLAAEPEGK